MRAEHGRNKRGAIRSEALQRRFRNAGRVIAPARDAAAQTARNGVRAKAAANGSGRPDPKRHAHDMHQSGVDPGLPTEGGCALMSVITDKAGNVISQDLEVIAKILLDYACRM